MTRRLAALALPVVLSALLAACVQPPVAPPVGLLDVAERPAEKALMTGMRAYDDAQYPQAEKQLQAALQAGLVSPRDRAAAHKLLAFIFCTSNRAVDCEVQFRSARAADPAFALSKSEAGHPLWGPVYQRVLQR
jgi:Tfp pilus assembly protein PilF